MIMVKTVCSKKWGNDSYRIADESDEILAKGLEELRIALNKMLSWRPNNIVISHGECIIGNGYEFLNKSFRWLQ